MIVAEQKPLTEVFEFIRPFERVLVLGCGTCVTVCSAGGQKEVATLASALAVKSKSEGLKKEFIQETIERQCDREFIEPVVELAKECDAIISMACGAGVQLVAEMMDPPLRVMPALNTKFMGYTREQGVWMENCRGCGDCVLHVTHGICPVTRCSKGLMNGPCGGYSKEGKCEVDPEVDCGWILIFNKLKDLGKLEEMKKIMEPKDWSLAAMGMPGKVERKDLQLNEDDD
jgi:ferredoxin